MPSEVWGPDYYGDTRTLDVHIKRLRGRIEQDPHSPRHLQTVRGLGYKFDSPRCNAASSDARLL